MRKTAAVLVLLALLAPASIGGELSEAARARLEREKVLVGTTEFRSVSSAYKGGEHPYLLTSDAVIFAFHSLLRETVARLEWARGAALRRALAAMEAGLPEARERFDLGETLASADRRARFVLATARLLLGDAPLETDEEARAIARAEAARVTRASGVVDVPGGYGPPDAGFPAVDYTRFRPAGILGEIPETAAVFRAASWLAFVPFRLDRDEELAAFLLLAAEGEEGEQAYWERLWTEVRKVPVLSRMGNDGIGILLCGRKEALGDKRAPTTGEERVRWAKALRTFAERVRSGGSYPRHWNRRRKAVTGSFGDLAAMADRMAAIAGRQLRGREPSEQDDAFVRGFGRSIGRILGEGDAPSDDAPVAVGVFSDPARGRHLVLGVGRPRALYVPYPVGEREVICRGVAIPWYETSLPAVPTDAEWKALLDSDEALALPAAVRTIHER